MEFKDSAHWFGQVLGNANQLQKAGRWADAIDVLDVAIEKLLEYRAQFSEHCKEQE